MSHVWSLGMNKPPKIGFMFQYFHTMLVFLEWVPIVWWRSAVHCSEILGGRPGTILAEGEKFSHKLHTCPLRRRENNIVWYSIYNSATIPFKGFYCCARTASALQRWCRAASRIVAGKGPATQGAHAAVPLLPLQKRFGFFLLQEVENSVGVAPCVLYVRTLSLCPTSVAKICPLSLKTAFKLCFSWTPKMQPYEVFTFSPFKARCTPLLYSHCLEWLRRGERQPARCREAPCKIWCFAPPPGTPLCTSKSAVSAPESTRPPFSPFENMKNKNISVWGRNTACHLACSPWHHDITTFLAYYTV